jgi:hypothetical protein
LEIVEGGGECRKVGQKEKKQRKQEWRRMGKWKKIREKEKEDW